MFAFVLRSPPSPPRRGGHPDYPLLEGDLGGGNLKLYRFLLLNCTFSKFNYGI
jgi:hypothetical protein